MRRKGTATAGAATIFKCSAVTAVCDSLKLLLNMRDSLKVVDKQPSVLQQMSFRFPSDLMCSTTASASQFVSQSDCPLSLCLALSHMHIYLS